MRFKPSQLPTIQRQLRADLESLLRTMQPRIAVLDLIPEGEASDAEEQEMGAVDATLALAQRVQFADLFLVTEQMTHLAVDAARDVPAGQRLAAVMPARTGIMAFSGGLPAMTDAGGLPGVTFTPSVLTWATETETTYVALWVHVPSHPHLREWPLFKGSTWVCVASSEAPSGIDETGVMAAGRWNELAPTWDDYRPATVRMMSLALAAWHLMQMPTVADTVARTEAGAKLGNGKRDAAREVKVIDMRRLARKPSPEDSEDGDRKRTYTHQWVVRGHWRQQPVGKGHSERRTTWVPSYLKGPEGAPFLPSETVFVWRR